MSNFVFNSMKGKVAYYATLPAASDGLMAVVLAASGIEADDAMLDHTTLASLLAASTNEHTLARKALTSVTVTPNTVSNDLIVDIDDFTYTAATGAAIASLVVCYVPSVGVSTDSAILPLTKHDFPLTPTGADIVVHIAADGIFKSTDA